jgi:hypothetical protein
MRWLPAVSASDIQAEWPGFYDDYCCTKSLQGVHLKYAQRFMCPEQIDKVDIAAYVGAATAS